ncbi:Adenylate cyclase 1 [Thalassocella blandensis]|nr:Adenylate cyclase 1 [Thalassocella blandensis]
MERRHLTLMFTDIVGYSRLMGQNEAQCIAMLGEYRRILLARIEQHRGTVIEFIGDAVFARFDTALAAVQAGVDIQKDLNQYNLDKDPALPKLQSRIGIHCGEVTLQNDALFGDDVNIAARLEPIAVAEGLCISDEVYQAVKDHIQEPILPLGTQPLKNIESKKIKAFLVRPSGITLGTHTHYWLKKTQQKLERYRYPLSVALLALILAGIYFIPRWLVPGYTAHYVEIADFKNLMSNDGKPDYLSAGITEALRSQLADIRNIYILEAGKGVRGPIRLEGSVQKIGDQLRIAYRLFRRKDNVQIAGGKLDGAYQDIFILQDRVVAEIAGYLAKEFDMQKVRPAAPRLTSDVTAYDYYLQGLEYLKKPQSDENYDEAIKLFSTALVHDANFAQANAGLCKAYRVKYLYVRSANWLNRAEEYCQLALQQNDSLPEVYESLGVIYRDTGREEEAIEILQKALSINPDKPEIKLELAKVYKNQGELNQAQDLMDEVILHNPDLWVAYYEKGNMLLANGKLDEALNLYDKVLSITPENEFALSNKGVAYFYLGQYKEAASAFDKALVYSPSAWAYSNTGTMYYFSGNFNKAEAMFREAIRLAPDDFKPYVNLGDVLRQLHPGTEKALPYYEKAKELALEGLALNKNDLQIYQYLAFSYLHSHDAEKAKESLQKAISLDATNVNTAYVKARVYAVTEDDETTLKALQELIALGYSTSLIEVDPDFSAVTKSPKFHEFIMASGD